MTDLTISHVDLAARIDGEDIVRGLNNNDESILMFITDMLNAAGSSDLESELMLRLKERAGIVEACVPSQVVDVAVRSVRS